MYILYCILISVLIHGKNHCKVLQDNAGSQGDAELHYAAEPWANLVGRTHHWPFGVASWTCQWDFVKMPDTVLEKLEKTGFLFHGGKIRWRYGKFPLGSQLKSLEPPSWRNLAETNCAGQKQISKKHTAQILTMQHEDANILGSNNLPSWISVGCCLLFSRSNNPHIVHGWIQMEHRATCGYKITLW